jgi:hypothetical protein
MLCLILNRRLSQIAEDSGRIVEESGGFRRGGSCIDEVMSLTLPGQTYISKKKTGMLSAFIDFKEAFDSVDRSKLWSRLEMLGLRGSRWLGFVQQMYEGNSCQVKIDNVLSDLEPFAVAAGVRQGCVLSSLLFSQFVNDLVHGKGVGICCVGAIVPGLMFADDLALVAGNDEGLKATLDELNSWCEDNSIEMNVDKCAILHMWKRGMKKTKSTFMIGSEEVKVVSSYKYLGCVLDEFLEMRQMIKSRAEARKRALGEWLAYCRSSIVDIKGGT